MATVTKDEGIIRIFNSRACQKEGDDVCKVFEKLLLAIEYGSAFQFVQHASPQQSPGNTWDCGLFACEYFRHFALNPWNLGDTATWFRPESIEVFKRLEVLCLFKEYCPAPISLADVGFIDFEQPGTSSTSTPLISLNNENEPSMNASSTSQRGNKKGEEYANDRQTPLDKLFNGDTAEDFEDWRRNSTLDITFDKAQATIGDAFINIVHPSRLKSLVLRGEVGNPYTLCRGRKICAIEFCR